MLNLLLLACRRQQPVESDSTPADQTEEETLPWTVLHGVRLSISQPPPPPPATQLILHLIRDVYTQYFYMYLPNMSPFCSSISSSVRLTTAFSSDIQNTCVQSIALKLGFSRFEPVFIHGCWTGSMFPSSVHTIAEEETAKTSRITNKKTIISVF